MANENEDLKALKCPECGSNIAKSYRIEGDDEDEERIPIAKCVSCGVEYDQYTQEYYELLNRHNLGDRIYDICKAWFK